MGCRDTDVLELQPSPGIPFSDSANYSTPKVGNTSTTFLIQATRRPSRTSNRQTLLNFISVNSQESGQCWRCSQSESWRGTVSRFWHLPRPLPSPGKVMDEWDVSSEQGSGGQVDGANNGSLTCQDDVLSTTDPTLKKVRGNQTRD